MKVGDLVKWKLRHPSWSHCGCAGVVTSAVLGSSMWVSIFWSTGIFEDCPKSMLEVINESR